MLTNQGLLILEDGTVFRGTSIGASGLSIGEVVFNTTTTGYQEILTDPSYYKQIVTLTFPHIGNVGINKEDEESSNVHLQGLVIRDLSLIASNFRHKENLSDYLKKNNVIAISDIDTRKLTKILRDKGSQKGCILSRKTIDIKSALYKIKSFSGLKGIDLVKEITTNKPYIWNKGSLKLQFQKNNSSKIENLKRHIIAYDFGIKKSILRMLVDRGCVVTVVPATTSAKNVIESLPDGIILSNGPGDPTACIYSIKSIKKLLKTNIPIFGICFGYQLLAIASGAKTIKMKFGHHGSNHPVRNLDNNKIMITSQNHNFVIDKNSIPKNLKITHKSLIDNTIQGITRIDKPAFGFQGHPEASPGPHDASSFFDTFIKLVDIYRKNKAKSKTYGDSVCQNVPI